MKFLKKLGTVLLVILVIVGIFGVVIAMNWDKFSAMPELMDQMEQEQQEQNAVAEATKEVTELMEQAWELFENENLVEFDITQVYTDTGEMAGWYRDRNAADRAQKLMRTVRKTMDPSDGIVREDYTQISSKTFDWPDMRNSNDTWVLYRKPEMEGTSANLYHDGQTYALEYDTWYFYDGWYPEQFGFADGLMPFGIMTAQITDYEKVGSEEIRGQMTTHYIITYQPMMRLPQALDMQYTHPNSEQLCAPRDYYSAAIKPQIIENYPELYADFMALMEARWYQDNQAHVWLTEDGRLLRVIYEYTFETYEMYFSAGYGYEYFEMSLTEPSTYEMNEEDGTMVEIPGEPSALALLRPVQRVVDISYGEEVEPIVLPETYAVPGQKEVQAYNQQSSPVVVEPMSVGEAEAPVTAP